MQWSRTKTILIVILLLVDGFLFFNIAEKYVSRSYRETENAHNIVEILTVRGIGIDPGFDLPDIQALPVLQADRSRVEEDKFAYGLLGEDAISSEQASGSTVRYTSGRGTLEWRDGGAVSGTIVPEAYTQPADDTQTKEQAEHLLTQAGLTTSSLTLAANGQTVTASFPTAGVPVFNRVITLTFEKEQIVLSGVWTFGMPYITKSGNYVTFAAADALFILISGTEIEQITGMEQGFLLSESGGGRVQLTPGWRINTNTGSFFVDSLKKSVSVL